MIRRYTSLPPTSETIERTAPQQRRFVLIFEPPHRAGTRMTMISPPMTLNPPSVDNDDDCEPIWPSGLWATSKGGQMSKGYNPS